MGRIEWGNKMTTKGHAYKLQEYNHPPQKMEQSFPSCSKNEVLLRVAYSGVCHSDVYIMDGYQDLGDGERIDFSETDMPMPLTMGHEIVGEVVEVGQGVDPKLIDQQRLIYPWIGCGHCISCKAGQDNHCETPKTLGIFKDGGYADYVLVPNQKYLVEIDDLAPAWACTLACSGLTIFSAFRQLKPQKPGSYIAVIGLGGLGLMAFSMAKAVGIENIVACDISEESLQVASEMGATAVLNTSQEDAEQQLSEITKGNLYGVIDTVGLPATMQLSVNACMKGGRIVLVGLQGGKLPLSLPILPFKALSLIGTYTGTLDELKELITLVKSNDVSPMPIQVRSMQCLHKTLEDLRAGNVIGRVVLTPS